MQYSSLAHTGHDGESGQETHPPPEEMPEADDDALEAVFEPEDVSLERVVVNCELLDIFETLLFLYGRVFCVPRTVLRRSKI